MVDRGTFGGMAATLLSLALLAERAAGRSLPVRFLLLAILGRAERIARAFVARELAAAGPGAPCLEDACAWHAGAAGAELLALRLRMLAAVLSVLAGADAGSRDRSGNRSNNCSDNRSGNCFSNWSDNWPGDWPDNWPGDWPNDWPGTRPERRCAGPPGLPLLLVFRLPAARRRPPPDTS